MKRTPAIGTLHARLPALYRERPGALLPLLEAIAATLPRLEEAANLGPSAPSPQGECEGATVPSPPVPVPSPPSPQAEFEGAAVLSPPVPPEGAGTVRALLGLLAEGGRPPAIHAGVEARPAGGEGLLEVAFSARRCALLVWPQGTDPRRADPALIPAALLPAGVELRSVVLDGEPPSFRIGGERFAGRIAG